jgi:hypothetical protein
MKEEILFKLSKELLDSVKFDAYKNGDVISIRTLKIMDKLERQILKIESSS